MIGQACAVLVDLPVDYQPHGWTMASHPGRDLARARDHWQRDLDALTQQGQGLPLLKVQLTGPLTLAASLELPNLHKVLTDHGAFRELAESLAEGARQLLGDLAGRLPGTALVLQLDEPAVWQVLTGQVPTPSGYGTVRSLPEPVAEAALAGVLAAAETRVLHCCGSDVPYRLFAAAGADAISVDANLIRDADLDAIGTVLDQGVGLWLGVLPGTDTQLSRPAIQDGVRGLWTKLGFAPALLPQRVVLSPSCGLAGGSMPYVRKAMSTLRDAARALREEA